MTHTIDPMIPDPFQSHTVPLSPTVQQAAETRLSQLSREEKLGLCHALSIFSVAGVERLGIPELVMSDGPHGVRREMQRYDFVPAGDCDDATTYLPVGIALGATWNVDLAREFGDTLGAEARARGKDIILGPGVNLIRTPLCGRNFEYLGEDPIHSGALAVEVVRAVQRHGVAACVKHYALNNQELNRHGVDVEVDDATLRELYLPAFELVVTRGGCLSVMGAYNLFRGQHCCHHDLLLNRILKQEWGFPYPVISDWGGVHDTDEAVRNGLDIEMGGKLKALYLDQPFREGLEEGRYDESLLDDKVRRVLRLEAAAGMFDPETRPAGRRLIPEHRDTARRIAQECIVLLKNEANLLPLDASRLRRVAVIGDNADRTHAAGGGSSGIRAEYEVTPLQGLRAALGDAVDLRVVGGYPVDPAGIVPIPVEQLGVADRAGIRGWLLEVFSNRTESGAPEQTSVVSVPEMDSEVCPLPNGKTGAWMAKWTGTVTPEVSGKYHMVCTGGDYVELRVNGEVVSSVWDLTEAITTSEAVELTQGRAAEVVIRYRPKERAQGLRFGWIPPGAETEREEDPFREAVEAADGADAVLVFAGSSHFQDTEGADRRDMSLIGGQNELIERLAAVNPNLVVVLFGGSAVELPWLDRVPAVLQAWYPGQEGGHAIADVLLGEVNPSGRLPFSWPKQLQDVAAHAHQAYGPNQTTYAEGMNHGNRWHGVNGPAALFPFGYGLSHTCFKYSDLKIDVIDANTLQAGMTLINTGTRPGAEVVQCYLEAEGTGRRELKSFAKVNLNPGEQRKLTFSLGPDTRRRWDSAQNAWTLANRPFQIHLAANADDLRLSGEVQF
ncbi:MAG: glycoside hydrolase family 3 C-terminal domain-containing protein [Verrucomicrobia bacterium]|nr:glycoside hydrolase family 3 C-terminal domain-containing protein [Verrucomicrobiota bacterium]MCH8512359.1 glycoside hydrolase family 3 C-terminal domain-containing protein [Kiritimatiellia bacterium]